MTVFRHFLLNTFLPALCVLGVIYNFLIALNGSEGLRARALTTARLEEANLELASLREYRTDLENKSALLSLRSLDDDMLDESARRLLGYAEHSEKVISMSELDRILKSGK